MDCPAEEQLVRMKLEQVPGIIQLSFDLPNRNLEVIHSGEPNQIESALQSLKLKSLLIGSVETIDSFKAEFRQTEKKLLWQVLGINLFFFFLELITGLIAGSMGLLADGLDMLADSIVYGMALFAVNKTSAFKRKVARSSAWFQYALAFLGLAEVIRRFIGSDDLPDYRTMMIISSLALLGNAVCLYLLQKSNNKEAHIQASKIFTSNDVFANLGVIVAGALVLLTASPLPDLIIGSLVLFLLPGELTAFTGFNGNVERIYINH